MKKKEQSIETLRGLAIILMVAGHVIGHNSGSGMKVEDDSLFRYFYYTLQYLRMPLFTVISGYVYSMRPYSSDSKISGFILGKTRRLIVPLISVSTLQYLLRVYIPGTNNPAELNDIWKIYIFSFDQFWFLQSIFLVFITIAIFEYYNLLGSFKSWAVLLILTALIRIFIPIIPTNFFSITGYFQLLPFFILGCGIKRYSDLLFNNRAIKIYLLIFITSFTFQQILWFSPLNFSQFGIKTIAFLVGISGITLLFFIRKGIPLLAKLGVYAFGIYLFHVFGTAGSRMLLKYIVLDPSPLLVFIVSLIFGLGLPIILEILLIKTKFTRQIFIGLK